MLAGIGAILGGLVFGYYWTGLAGEGR